MKTSKVIPAVVLVLLLVAWLYRWNYVASKTYSNGVVRWKIDRWTGYRWVEVYTAEYGNINSGERPAYIAPRMYSAALRYRKIATRIWYGLVAADCVWLAALLIAPAVRRKRETGAVSQSAKEA